MDTAKQIGNKINKLMEEKNMSLRHLSEVIGVSHPTLKRYVDGEKPIDSDKLLKIANYFNKSFDYFFKSEDDTLGFMFRADKPKDTIKEVELEKLRQSLNGYLDIVKDIKLSIVPPKYHVEESTYDTDRKTFEKLIEQVANNQRRQFNIEHVIPENYFNLLDEQGIHVLAIDFHNDEYFGVSSYSETKGSFIIVNDSKAISEERKVFSLFHEYAHLLFHRHQYSSNGDSVYYKSGRTDRTEKVANHFAGCFLMPRNLVEKYLNDNDKETIDPYHMKKHFKVSLQTLYVVLYKYGYIRKKQYTDFWKKTNAQNKKETEEEPMDALAIEDKNSRLIKAMRSLYFKGDISVNKITEIMRLCTKQTRNLVNTWRPLDDRAVHLK